MLTILTPAATGNLTVLATVKAELGITSSSDDVYLETLICQASQMLASACCRSTFGAERVRQTERITTALETIILQRDLNIAVVSVCENGTVLAADDYERSGARLYRLVNNQRERWMAGRVVEITYDSGYDLLGGLPHDLERACLEVIKAAYHGRARDPLLRNESVEGIGSSAWLDPRLGMEALPPQAAALAAPYRAWAV